MSDHVQAAHDDDDVYRRAQVAVAVIGAIVATAYLVGWYAAIADGNGIGLEVPRAVNSVCIAVICSTCTISSTAWFIRRAIRIATEDHIGPLVRQELDRAFADAMPLFIASIADAADRRAAGVADQVAERLDDQLHELYQKTLINGMTMHADATGEQLGKTALRSVKTYVGTSRGD